MRGALLLLVAGALAFGVWFCSRPRFDVVPMTPLQPSLPRAEVPAGGAASDGAALATGAAVASADTGSVQPTDANGGGTRTAMASPPGRIVIRVVHGATAKPQAGIEVGIAVTARSGSPKPAAGGARRMEAFHPTARTDGDGTVAFAFAIDEPVLLRVACGLGASQLCEVRPAAEHKLTLTVQPAVEIDGIVVDGTGAPIAGAELWYHGWQVPPMRNLPALLGCGRSDTSGRFHLTVASGGDLAATHPAFAPSQLLAVADGRRNGATAPATAAPAEPVRIVLGSATGTVQAQVVDADGTALAGAEVEFCGPGAAALPQRFVSGADGALSARPLAAGTNSIVAWHPRAGCSGDTVVVPGGGEARIVIRIQGCASLTGIVRDDHGQPVHGATIRIAGAGLASARTRSGPDGTYRLDGVLPGSREAIAEVPPADAATATRTEVRAGLQFTAGRTTRWDPSLPAGESGVTLIGSVVDRRGQALAQWVVVATAAGQQSSLRTDRDGRFAITCPHGLELDLAVFEPGHDPGTAAFPLARIRDADPSAGPVRIEVDPSAPRAQLRGRIARADRTPLAATIEIWHHERLESLRFAPGPDGTFELPRVPVGTVDIHVQGRGAAAQTRRDIDLPAGAIVDVGTIELSAGATLSGRITRTAGAEAAGVAPMGIELWVATADQRISALVDGDTYRVDSLPAGNLRLLVSGPGIAATAVPLQLSPGEEQQLDIQVAPGVSRTVRVTLPAGNGSRISLLLRDQGGTDYTWIASQPRPAMGTVEFVACMRPGAYDAIAFDDEGLEARGTLTIGTANGAPPFDLELRAR